MINEKLENLVNSCRWNEVIGKGMFINSKLMLFANVPSPRRCGIFKYIITPHSFTEKRLSSFCFNFHGKYEENDPYSDGKKYHFFFDYNRTDEYMVIDADSIEDLCNQLELSSGNYDDMVICLSKFCPDVPLKGKADGTPENKTGE